VDASRIDEAILLEVDHGVQDVLAVLLLGDEYAVVRETSRNVVTLGEIDVHHDKSRLD
jgi:hypothetical protein